MTQDPLDSLFSDMERHGEDDGFTERVLERLPPARGMRPGLRAGVLLVSTALAGGVTLIALPGGRVLVHFAELLASHAQSPAVFLAGALVGLVPLAGLGVARALQEM